jgi:hypothetical protein
MVSFPFLGLACCNRHGGTASRRCQPTLVYGRRMCQPCWQKKRARRWHSAEPSNAHRRGHRQGQARGRNPRNDGRRGHKEVEPPSSPFRKEHSPLRPCLRTVPRRCRLVQHSRRGYRARCASWRPGGTAPARSEHRRGTPAVNHRDTEGAEVEPGERRKAEMQSVARTIGRRPLCGKAFGGFFIVQKGG